MTDNPPTVASEDAAGGAAPTTAQEPVKGPTAALAYSEELPVVEARRSRLPIAVFVAAVLALVGAVTVGVVTTAGWLHTPAPTPQQSAPPSPQVASSSEPPMVVPPPPSSVAESSPTAATLVPPSPPQVWTPPPVASPPVPMRSQEALDEEFLTEMTEQGMRISDVRAAVAGAHSICDYLAAGHTGREAAALAMRNNASLTPANAEMLVMSAVRVYCPEEQ